MRLAISLAAGLATNLAKSKAVATTGKALVSDKAAKGFAAGMKSINTAQKNGAWDSMNRYMDKVKGSGPEAAAWTVFMSKITSATVGARVELLKSLLIALESPGGQLAIDALSGLINLMADSGSVAAAGITGVSTALKDAMDINPEDATTFQTAMDKIKKYLTDPNEWEYSTNWWITTFKNFDTNAKEAIKGFIVRMGGELQGSLDVWIGIIDRVNSIVDGFFQNLHDKIFGKDEDPTPVNDTYDTSYDQSEIDGPTGPNKVF